MPTQTKNVRNVFGQPARVLAGDPTQASGAGLTDFASVLRANIQVRFFRQITSNEIGQMLNDGGFGAVQGARISLQMFNAQAALLAALMPEVAASTDALTFSGDMAVLANPSLIIVPEADYGAAAASDYVWYVPAVIPVDVSEFIFKIEETQTSGEPFTVNLEALLRTADQDDVALADGKQILFRGGKPAAWTFPAGY